MKTTVSLYEFREAFRRCDRLENFCYEGLEALFDHLENYEQDCGEEIELDVISLCCEFSEYTTAYEAAVAYGWEPETQDDLGEIDEDEQEELALDFLNDNTIVIKHNKGIIVQSF